ncbi:hypothetical protein ETU09_04345 [Apibacter muscae]|uniref:DUF4350 domain-containing protein n=1 Tax=Apibacter muscae TaxID=2509004 RepID=A0A563DG22_9FLAO|nr:DUF4350 domain-containing protein [Apibacter muscae]TWP29077.1 hypothetical protein ETU09_04345 [Apibacter muscae]
MNKHLKIYIGIFIIVIGGLMYLEYQKPKPVDWTETYSSKDKIPLGTYVLFQELSKLFPQKTVTSISETPSSYLFDNEETYDSNSLYFFLNKNSTISETDLEYLNDFVNVGGDVFIISNHLPEELEKQLNVETDIIYNSNRLKDRVKLRLVNPSFEKQEYTYNKVNPLTYFSKIDTTKSVILGELTQSGNRKANFIKTKYGEGNFYIHLLPEAFTNYYLLNDDTYTYAIHSLNYIDKKNILWDEQNKSINSVQKGILMYIFSSPALTWAWRVLILGSIIYVLFLGKRLQRIIPIVNPLKNTTVEFTKTIGNIYFNQREHQDIINKKITYFLYFVKEKYFLNTAFIDENFSEKLHTKSGVSKEITDKIVSLIQKNRDSKSSTENDLKLINQTIDLFYTKI